MIVTHKNTGTLGDFATQLPLLCAIKHKYGFLHLSLPKKYLHFNGLKEFLLYQDFVDIVDFDDITGDIDIQAHACDLPRPSRARYSLNKFNIEIQDDLKLKFKDIHIPSDLLNRPIVIDKNTPANNRPIMQKCGLFDTNYYQYLTFDNIQNINYNLNICLKTRYPIYSCLTGFPVLLQYFSSIDLNIIWFSREDQQLLSIPFFGEDKPFYETYFNRPNIKLHYWKDLVL